MHPGSLPLLNICWPEWRALSQKVFLRFTIFRQWHYPIVELLDSSYGSVPPLGLKARFPESLFWTRFMTAWWAGAYIYSSLIQLKVWQRFRSDMFTFRLSLNRIINDHLYSGVLSFGNFLKKIEEIFKYADVAEIPSSQADHLAGLANKQTAEIYASAHPTAPGELTAPRPTGQPSERNIRELSRAASGR